MTKDHSAADEPEGAPPYEELLDGLRSTHPTIEGVLRAGHEARTRSLAALVGGLRLKGLEQLITHLFAVESSWREDSTLAQLTPLLGRLTGTLCIALEASLTSQRPVVANQMREFMEMELLLHDFAYDPGRIEQWLTANEETVRRQFSPNALRNRLANAGFARYAETTSDSDYIAHSRALHITAAGLELDAVMRSLFGALGSPWDDSAFVEIFEHSRRTLEAIDRLSLLADNPSAVPTIENLDDVRAGWRATQEMMAMILALNEAADKADDESEESE